MAKLVDIYNSEKEPVIKRRQLPLTIYENLTVSGFMHFDITTSVDYSGKRIAHCKILINLRCLI